MGKRRKIKKCEEKLDAPTSEKSITRSFPGISMTVTWYHINWHDSEMFHMMEVIEDYLKELVLKLPPQKQAFEPVHRKDLGE